MVGSEGTLGVITKAVLKLLPKNNHNVLMMVPFYKAHEACEAVSAIFRAGIVPSALEFMERDAIDWTVRFVEGISVTIKPEHQAHLLIEVDGNYPEILMQEAERILSVVEQFEIDEVLFADNDIKECRNYIDKEIGKKYCFQSVCYGHAGDGNLHVNIIKADMTDDNWNTQVPIGIREIFELTVSLKGTLSGEHGIGFVQKNFMDIAFSKVHLELMERIKHVFDPNNILNPGKIFPDEL